MDDDRSLILGWRAGDTRAGQQLVERHYAAVERFFFTKTSPAAAPDLIQTTFLKLVESVDRFDVTRDFRPFLFGVARNVLLMYFRSHRRDADRLDFNHRSVADLVASVAGLLAAEEEAQLLLQALRRIPLEAQILLELYYWESMDGPELAAMLDVPLGTARTRLRQAKIFLRRELERLAGAPALLESTVSNLELWAARLRGHAHAPR